MAYTPRVLVERILDFGDVPWQLAPKAVQDAAAAAGQATSDHMNAASALDDAELEVPISLQVWEGKGKASIRKGEPLPSRDPIEVARLGLEVAKEDEHLAERRLAAAVGSLAGLLSDATTRDTFREAIEKRVETGQAKLARVAASIADQAAEVANDLSFCAYLGRFGQDLLPPNIDAPDPAGALRRLSTLQPWTPPRPAGEARIMEPTAKDDRPPVFIRNSEGGVHNVVAKNVDALLEQPGWRRATDAEIAHWHKRQGLPVPA